MVLIDMTQGILMTGLLVEGDAKPASVHAGFLVEKPLLDVIKFSGHVQGGAGGARLEPPTF